MQWKINCFAIAHKNADTFDEILSESYRFCEVETRCANGKLFQDTGAHSTDFSYIIC